MQLQKLFIILGAIAVLGSAAAGAWYFRQSPALESLLPDNPAETLPDLTQRLAENLNPFETHPLAIEFQRAQEYPGSELVIEQNVATRNGYREMVASYQSEGLKIYGLLTIPTGTPPEGGWPIIIFNHGYIPPEQYRTTERYEAYQDLLARAGYITFKSDYRGHGSSEGEPTGAYYSPGYLTDVLNALASVQKLPEANPNKVGMWGHSLGGNLTQRSMVISDQIDAAVIWGGVVSSYEDIAEGWTRVRSTWSPSAREERARRNASSSSRTRLEETIPEPMRDLFWQTVDPALFLSQTNTPLQLHHGQADETVDWRLSEQMAARLEESGKTVELHFYPGADHNLSGAAFSPAMSRTIEFFDRYLKE